ncbi:nickel-responsive transcriptional regulator NikR [Piscinibacter terrae]|uniref:Putative nickel-responsive regulator n=1 Tax=Piscinibacter terrae TaxID=2496871 RepID=A0A3N7HUJ2_9BURK|nr:nickel-responsive transcriptional regulator NikR [Albitalea terrae]RQP24976.1 nickel-responsive transcriptional regulator NikR [Albitalea terrae]
MKHDNKEDKAGVGRISVSLPAALLEDLDRLVIQRGYNSRSQAIAEVVHAQVVDSRNALDDDVMVGTITLHYDRSVRGLQTRLADLQYQHIDEVISSLHVQLSQAQVLEVLLVQGRGSRLQEIAQRMLTCRGVLGGRLQVHAAAMPPVQTPATRSRTTRTQKRVK